MTSSSSVAPTSPSGRLNAVAPERAKKLAKRLHKIADRHHGVLRIQQLSDAQGVVAELFGLPDWHALERQPDVLPKNSAHPLAPLSPSPSSLVPSSDAKVWRIPEQGWTWYALRSPRGTLSVQQVVAHIRFGLMKSMRVLVTNGGCVALAVTKYDNPASMTVHLGVPPGYLLADRNDPSWTIVHETPSAWQAGRTTMNNLDRQNVHGLGDTSDWTILGRPDEPISWLRGQIALQQRQAWTDELETLLTRAEAWWSALAERPGHTSLALGLDGGITGEIRASLLVGLHDHPPGYDLVDTWKRLCHSVDLAKIFKEMRPDDHEVRVSAEAWPWPANEYLAMVDAYDPTQLLSWDPQSPKQTSHVATIAPANAVTRRGWINGVLRHMVQVRDPEAPPVAITVLASEQQVQQLQASSVALVPWDIKTFQGFNPFDLPEPHPDRGALDHPDPTHRNLLIAGLQAMSGAYEGTQDLWSLLLDRAYALCESGQSVSVQTLLDQLNDETIQKLFKDLHTPLGDPLIVMARQALTSLRTTMLGERKPALPLRLALPVGGNDPALPALTWFAMAYVHAMRSSDAWTLDATVLPSLMSDLGKEALTALTSQQRRFGNRLTLIANDEDITGNLAELSTLVVSNTNPTRSNTMRLLAYTRDGQRTRIAEWMTETM